MAATKLELPGYSPKWPRRQHSAGAYQHTNGPRTLTLTQRPPDVWPLAEDDRDVIRWAEALLAARQEAAGA
jgi:hypothetical protein